MTLQPSVLLPDIEVPWHSFNLLLPLILLLKYLKVPALSVSLGTPDQYEARGQAKCVRSSSLKTELTVALEPNTLRRAALCEKEMRRLGIHYTVHDSSLSFTRLPVCLLEKDESEQRAGRPSTLASRMEVSH